MDGQIKSRLVSESKVKLTPTQETERKLELYDEIQSVTEISQELEALREKAALIARKKDIDYVLQLDEFIETVLSSLANDKHVLAESIAKMLRGGNTKLLKELMVALGISIDKREKLLGFDDQRRKQDSRKLKFEVLWKGGDGSQAGVKIEEV